MDLFLICQGHHKSNIRSEPWFCSCFFLFVCSLYMFIQAANIHLCRALLSNASASVLGKKHQELQRPNPAVKSITTYVHLYIPVHIHIIAWRILPGQVMKGP